MNGKLVSSMAAIVLALVHSSAGFTAVDKAFLARHNEYRAKHGSPPLQLRQDLIHLAQDWSNKLARRDELAHRPNNKFGECVSHAGSTDPITINADVANDAVTAFYSEVYFYDFNNDSVATHFSQVVWKNTKYVGCGCATTRDKFWVYCTCNYDPSGNYPGEFHANVVPAIY